MRVMEAKFCVVISVYVCVSGVMENLYYMKVLMPHANQMSNRENGVNLCVLGGGEVAFIFSLHHHHPCALIYWNNHIKFKQLVKF